MYRVGQRAKNKRKRIAWFTLGFVSIIVLAVFGVGLAKRWLRPQTSIKQAAAVITHVGINSTATHLYDEPSFTIALPNDWLPVAGSEQPYNVYRWQNTVKSTTGRLLEVYEDTIPQSFPVNRILAVDSNGAQVSVLGTVSDNCVDFTKNVAPAAGQTGVHAKWEGIDFLCDLGNYERNVVGTSSSAGINTVTLKGNTTGTHQFFFTYTDHNINPDYSIFYEAITSFKVK